MSRLQLCRDEWPLCRVLIRRYLQWCRSDRLATRGRAWKRGRLTAADCTRRYRRRIVEQRDSNRPDCTQEALSREVTATTNSSALKLRQHPRVSIDATQLELFASRSKPKGREKEKEKARTRGHSVSMPMPMPMFMSV